MRDLSELPDGWRSVRLGDVVTMSQGGTPRKKRPEYWGGHIPFVTGADLREVRVSREHARSFLSEDGLRSGDTVICEPDALLLATRTRVGLAGMATEVLGASQDITRLEPNGDVDPSYLCRVLVRNAPTLQRRARGTTIQGISRGDVASLQILVPPLSEQRGIAAILDALDEAIERTEAVISATERLRDALLNELLTRGVPGWHTEWRTVPGLGIIPADWRIRRLSEVAEVKGGKRLPKGASFADEDTGLPYIRIVDFRDRTVDSYQIKYLRPETHDAIRRYTIRSSDIYISIAGTIGLVGIVPCVLDGANLTENAAKITIFNYQLLSQYVLLAFLVSRAGQAQIYRRINALGQPKLALHRINTISIPLPSICEQRTISTTLASVGDGIDQLREEDASLQSLKAAATDMLLTGRVRMANKIDHA